MCVLGGAIQQLLFVVDGLGAGLLFGGVQLVALRLQLLGEIIDLFGETPELRALGFVLLLQVGEVALALIGLGNSHLEGDHGNLGWTGRRRGGGSLGSGAQDKTRGQRNDKCK